MTGSIAALREAMQAAAAALDFEEAQRLRDQISLLRAAGEASGTGIDPAAIDPSGLQRQQPGAMGLGTSQQRVTPPAGWVKPRKPDPMTKGRSRGRKPLP
ncbi:MULTISPECIES: UvrB/UvrC motif-containing protein [unclassified Sphingomonas]|jgi:hypothetical protein|uniref:UvrB/UvrC motif-containing protein n=1 Tax=unclassified Sphingomonas TaxID=196159 RepID=UPI00226A1422|nr:MULTISPECIES: UvrB/UvrC motif-containing protein [unclassified Sphingomonas]